jgi:Tfp pilus assembly protein FimT
MFRRAITLIELLVVISIFELLVSLLLPATLLELVENNRRRPIVGHVSCIVLEMAILRLMVLM